MLVALLIHIVANAFLKEFPPADPTLAELQAYLEAEAGTWRIVHGMRYLAVVCLTVFLAAMFLRIQRANVHSSGGWEYVGFAGGLLHVTNLFITNGIETFAFLDFGLLSERPELFWLVFHSTRVLFNVEIVAWSILIFGFSLGGWNSMSIPRSISALGYIASFFALLSGVFVGATMTIDGLSALAVEVAVLSSLAWFLCVGIFLVWRGAS